MRKKGKAVTNETTANDAFGDRLKHFRMDRGWTQTDLGEHVGISQRVVAYYETEGGSPAPELLIKFADALNVSTDVLLGRKNDPKRTSGPSPKNLRLLRQFEQLEQLPAEERKTVLKMIDAFASRPRKSKAG
jgi:transcriptional regulator with XRE-family HTH domain